MHPVLRVIMLSRIYEWIVAKIQDAQDAKYWGNVFAMTGVACVAVATLEIRPMALLAGAIFCMVGLRLDRKGRKNDSQ